MRALLDAVLAWVEDYLMRKVLRWDVESRCMEGHGDGGGLMGWWEGHGGLKGLKGHDTV